MKFIDSFGNDVTDGTIISTYGHNHMNGQQAKVFWDSQHGQYRFVLNYESSIFGHDFWGIHKFKVTPIKAP